MTEPAQPDLAAFRDFFETSPTWRHLDQRLVSVGRGSSRLSMPLAPYQNVFGVTHGGVLAVLLDSAMAVAARAALGLDTRLATIEFKVSFLAPAPPEEVIAEGRLVHATKRIAFTDAQVRAADGALLATATGTFHVGRSERSGA
jgi:uncharacterized protein (TIGR00369 family)